ncbi:MAG: ABC transporter ATP-binding protein [Deltaproteobacteria bacterium]|nr:ABC transporter ATP-binding protein [Deltaproteobacteria bacterium]
MTQPLLTVSNLTKSFHPDGRNPVLKDLSFTAHKGRFLCILGPSGCGKTTLLKTIAGFLPPTGGTVEVAGRPVTRPGPDRCMVFQEDALFPWLTINVAFAIPGKKKRRLELARFHLHAVGLSHAATHLPHQLSGGMKQRAALARALALSPQILLMDEPFGSLDTQAKAQMQKLLLTLWAQLAQTILFVTHDPTEAATLADKVLIMGNGRIEKTMEINLQRPRNRKDVELFRKANELEEELKV